MEAATASRRKAFLRMIVIDLAIMTAIGVVLALIGPFGSFNDPLALRLIVWLGFAYVGYALYSPIDALSRRAALALEIPAWLMRVAGVLLASLPMAAVVWALPRWPDRLALPDVQTGFTHYLYVAVVGGLITLLFTLIQRAKQPSDTPLVEPLPDLPAAQAVNAVLSEGAARPVFMDRLSPELGSALIALEMEDHYVRAHTALGSELVLLRMRDAVAELGDIDGAQVHRSWWVARGSVADVRREGRNIRLVLENGLDAPVSRANVALLKEQGWF